jgi:16S rRNA (guanine966-N2)-methyltransferase
VREAVFSSLASLGAVEGARVLDLFAGSGALGIEALSRGAAAATFVDDDPRAVEAIQANLAATGLEGSIVRADASGWLASAAEFDLALVDPPYAFDGWPALLARLASRTSLAVLETSTELDPGLEWAVVRLKRYGDTVVTTARSLRTH